MARRRMDMAQTPKKSTNKKTPKAPAAKKGKPAAARASASVPSPKTVQRRSASTPKKSTRGKKQRAWSTWSNQQKSVAVAGAIVGVLALGTLGTWAVSGSDGVFSGWRTTDDVKSNVHSNQVDEPAPPIQSLVPRHLDGVIVPRGEENPQIVAVMIENLSSVRPHSGLQGASVVYETVAEAGITRFMALYPGGGNEPEIRPVRSARPYYLEWAAEVDAAYAHAGGSPNALRTISAFDYKDLNALGYAARYFWRGAGVAPHNLYTSSEKLQLALRDNEWNEPRLEYRSWVYDDDPADAEDRDIRNISEPPKPLPEKDASDVIEVGFGGSYGVRFEYDPERNKWLRWNGGAPHIDKNTGEQIAFTNVVVQRVPAVNLEAEKGRVIMNVTGEGQAWTCHDGTCTEGRWKKESRERRTLWYEANADGTTNAQEELHLTRGNTWVVVVPEPYSIDIRSAGGDTF